MGRFDSAVLAVVATKLSKNDGTVPVSLYDAHYIQVEGEQDCIDLLYSYIFSGNYFYYGKSSSNNKNNNKMHHQLQELPRDIQAEIMARLPATSILRLRSVCHDWYDMSREPSTIVENLAHSNKGHIVRHSKDQFHLIETNNNRNAVFRLRPLPSNAHIIGSCNGILCLVEYRDNYWKSPIDAIYLYNPLLGGECLVLPHHQITPNRVIISDGFFFDHERSHFKVVIFVGGRRSSNVSIVTCTIPMVGERIGTPQPWKIIQSELNYYLHYNSCIRLILVNGKVHVLLNRGKMITSFDIATEEIASMPLYFIDGNNYMALRIGELGSRLFVTYISELFVMELWVMEDYDNPKSWSKQLWLHHPFNWSPIVPYILNEDEIFFLHGCSPYMVQHSPSLISLPSAKPIQP